jgi:hypothetical protein
MLVMHYVIRIIGEITKKKILSSKNMIFTEITGIPAECGEIILQQVFSMKLYLTQMECP